MGIFFHRRRSLRLPLLVASEHIMGLPAEGLEIRNPAFKLIYFIHGAAGVTIDGEEHYRVTGGDLLILPKPCTQKYRSPGGDTVLHTLVFQFDPGKKGLTGTDDALARYLREHFSRPRHVKTHVGFPLWDLVSRLRREGDWEDEWSPLVLQEIVKQFVFQSAETVGIHRPPLPAQAAARVEESCTELLRTVYEGRAAGRAAADGRALFPSHIGMTFSRFNAVVRVERAKEEMLHCAQPLTNIARRLGFASPSTFSRTFREVTGLPPREYQQRLHDQAEEGAPLTPVPALPAPSPVPVPGTWVAGETTLLFCLGGDLEARSGKLGVLLSAAEATVLLAKAGSRWKFTAPAEARLVALALPMISGKQAGNALIRVARGYDLDKARRYGADACDHARLYVDSLLKGIAVEVVRQVRTGGWPKKQAAVSVAAANRLPVDYAREYIRKNFRRASLSLSEIAWFAGVSEEHLSRIFRRFDGKSVMRFLLEHRLAHAGKLLAQTGQSVAAIAEASGFASAISFSRAFRREKGQTPGKFRRMAFALQRIIKHG